MKMREIVGLILAFAMLGLLIGLAIVIFSKEGTLISDIGFLTVILSVVVAAVSQIILWISGRRERYRTRRDREK